MFFRTQKKDKVEFQTIDVAICTLLIHTAKTDEKFNKEEFENKVSETNRLITKGIEVGHIFYFGDKYSKPMNASVDLPGGKKDFVKMGS